MKILVVFGTRPEAIKMAPVIQSLGSGISVDLKVCVTAQHREMLDQVLDIFQISPDYDLDIMQDRQSLAGLTSRLLMGLDPVLSREQPDWVLVQGDTTTAMAAGLASYYHQISIGHVEAGLRSECRYRPFPEEMNRSLLGTLATLHFAPTPRAAENLLREGVSPDRVLITGNTVIDALHAVVTRLERTDERNRVANPREPRMILVTAHRRESLGEPLEDICLAIRDIAGMYGSSVRVLFPVHRNPSVHESVYRFLGDLDNVRLVQPLDYLSFVRAMQESYLILTDSGGIQEEAPGLGKPVLVLRDVTERGEAVEAGTVRLVGTRREAIVDEASLLLNDSRHYQRMARAVNPYGDGHAAERIAHALRQFGKGDPTQGLQGRPTVREWEAPVS
jgi:UDP-N-acetylglucosamine 2-epimerase (non-hydrolysing)